jgi:catechol 2,3-dioxygenase-like lactoylglutathione lyase family enzyme
LFHGIDHTALTVGDAETTLAFYTRAGFVCSHRQINAGAEQRRLDGFKSALDVKVEILSLSPPDGARPGVELLAYRNPPPFRRTASDGSPAATTMLIQGNTLLPSSDPDGHRIVGLA